MSDRAILEPGKASGLKQHAVFATVWSGSEIFLRQGLQFIASVALARLLSPEDFGTVALLSMFTGIATVFVDSGFSAALIQRRGVTHVDESTVFWFNLAAGAAVSFLLLLLAPIIAHAFSLPILIPLTAVMAVNVFISALGSIHATLLTKHLNFRDLMKVGAAATLVSGGVATAMAWRGYGVWALAAQTIVSTAMTTGLLWSISSWRPAFVFSMHSVRRFFGFGGYLLGSSLLDMIYARIWTVLIGSFFGVRELGFYSRADNTKQVPIGTLTGILMRVAFPVFSAASHDKEQLRRGVRFALRSMMLINVPMMLGLAAIAEPLILSFYGQQWLGAVPFFQILCLGAALHPLQVINLNVLSAQGHSKLFFRLEIVKLLLGLALLGGGVFFGMIGIAWSQVVMCVLGFGINAYYTKRYLDYGVVAQSRDVFPVIATATAMALAVTWMRWHSPLTRFPAIMTMSAFGALIFVGGCWLFKVDALHDVIELLRGRKPEVTESPKC